MTNEESHDIWYDVLKVFHKQPNWNKDNNGTSDYDIVNWDGTKKEYIPLEGISAWRRFRGWYRSYYMPTDPFKWSDEDEQNVNNILKSLDGLPIFVQMSKSWKWIQGERVNDEGKIVMSGSAGCGDSCYQFTIELFLFVDEKRIFTYKPWCPNLTKSTHWMANRCLWEVIPNKVSHDMGYEYAPFGYKCRMYSRKDANVLKTFLGELFSDVDVYISNKIKDDGSIRHKAYNIDIVLPDVKSLYTPPEPTKPTKAKKSDITKITKSKNITSEEIRAAAERILALPQDELELLIKSHSI